MGIGKCKSPAEAAGGAGDGDVGVGHMGRVAGGC
jgi:hypothetical protein